MRAPNTAPNNLIMLQSIRSWVKEGQRLSRKEATMRTFKDDNAMTAWVSGSNLPARGLHHYQHSRVKHKSKRRDVSFKKTFSQLGSS